MPERHVVPCSNLDICDEAIAKWVNSGMACRYERPFIETTRSVGWMTAT